MSWAGLDRRTVSAVIVIVDAGAFIVGYAARASMVVLTACAAETAACFLGYFGEEKEEPKKDWYTFLVRSPS